MRDDELSNIMNLDFHTEKASLTHCQLYPGSAPQFDVILLRERREMDET